MKFSDRVKKVRDKRVQEALDRMNDRVSRDIEIIDILDALDEMAEEDAADPYAHGGGHTRRDDAELVRKVLMYESDAPLSANYGAALEALRRLARS